MRKNQLILIIFAILSSSIPAISQGSPTLEDCQGLSFVYQRILATIDEPDFLDSQTTPFFYHYRALIWRLSSTIKFWESRNINKGFTDKAQFEALERQLKMAKLLADKFPLIDRENRIWVSRYTMIKQNLEFLLRFDEQDEKLSMFWLLRDQCKIQVEQPH